MLKLDEVFSRAAERFNDLAHYRTDYAAVVPIHEAYFNIGLEDDHIAPLGVASSNIHFENITFTYSPERPVFQNFNLIIPAGQKVGVVGGSGAGKSTFINLLLRFYDPQSGRIMIGGQSLNDVSTESLRQKIGLIPQDTSLFETSILENILVGNPHASLDDVIRAAKKAHAHEFIELLPQGYDTLVGERGVKLSGGQRQRIAIARAVLKNAPILILDEATSALDSESEKYIQDSLNDLMKDKTVIVIAHRLSTLSHLDRIVVLNKGQLVEDGSHTSLLAQNGLYARLWGMQSGGFL